MEKRTKKDYYAMLLAMDCVSANAELVEFIEKEVAALDAKAEKAKERAAEKAKAGDELRQMVYAVLTDEPQSIDAIVEQIAVEDVTKAKITARLTQLAKAGMAAKEEIKVGDRKVSAYKRMDVPELAE